MFPSCVLRCRHGHVYFFDTSCEHDQVALCSYICPGGWTARCATYGWQAHRTMFPSCVLRCRHGHVYFSDSRCKRDQTDGWVVALLNFVSSLLRLQCEMRCVPFSVFWALSSLWDRSATCHEVRQQWQQSHQTSHHKKVHMSRSHFDSNFTFTCTCQEVRQHQNSEPAASSLQARTCLLLWH